MYPVINMLMMVQGNSDVDDCDLELIPTCSWNSIIQDIYCDSKRWWRLMASTTRDCIIGFANTIPQTESSLSFSGLLYPINQMDPFYPLSHFIISSMYEILHKILKILKKKIKKTMKH